MILRARVEPLDWESQFFGLQSAIVRVDESAAALSAETLSGWERVQAKIPANRPDWLDALQQLGFRLVEGEVDLIVPVTAGDDVDAAVATEADIPVLRHKAADAFALSRFRSPWYAPDASCRFYARGRQSVV